MTRIPDRPADTGLIEALHRGVHSDVHTSRRALFGQFVGSWDLQWFGRDIHGVAAQLPGELHVGWILDGQAVQDVWIVPRRGIPSRDRTPGFHGTTVRFYDPTIDAWRSTWIDPPNGKVRRFIARPAAAQIVLLTDDRQQPGLRWTFTDIARDTFRWVGDVFDKQSNAFVYHQHMLATRTSQAETGTG